MDQKNYIEEMNRNLAANVTNLQARVETLTTSNALMREDLAISKRKGESLEEEQESLQGELERQTNMAQLTRAAQQVDRAADMEPTIVTVAKERHIREELEKELKLEIVMKAE